MKCRKPTQISLWASEKIFMNANRMQASKFCLQVKLLSFFFGLRIGFMLSLPIWFMPNYRCHIAKSHNSHANLARRILL